MIVLFHLTDRITGYEPGRSIRARKVTSRSEPYWRETPDGPVMPAPLILETLCQALGWSCSTPTYAVVPPCSRCRTRASSAPSGPATSWT
ncbi:hypothetical protein GCM10029976_009450 [Kribbella albertanoniae]